MSKRLLRGMLPLAVALAATPGCLLPAIADAAPLTSMPAAATPDRAAEWWLTTLGAARAWQSTGVKPPGTGVTVAVLSTGVDASHPDLAGVVTTGPDYSGSGAGPKDQFWGVEGTAVASLIAGHGHGPGDASGTAGLQGITGVAPGAKILSLRVTLEYNDARNGTPAITRHLADAIADGIRYAVAHGASVIALPLDPGTLGPVLTGDPAAAGGSPRQRAAVSYALAHGVVLIAPAGDNGASTGSVTYPAAYPGVLAVGATDQAGDPEIYSNRGAFVGLTAPGSGLTVAAPGGGYITIKTTDMAAALTAGVAALIRAKYPRLTPAEVNQAITHGSGALNAVSAVQAAAAIAARLPQATPSSAPGTASPSAPAAPLASPVTSNATTAPPGGGASTAGSVVRDAAIGAGALIALLIVALLATHARQRRVRAARARHGPRPQEAAPARYSARPGTGGFPAAITGGFPALSSHGAHAAPRGSGADARGTGGDPVLPTRVPPAAARTPASPARPALESRPGTPPHRGRGHASPGHAAPGHSSPRHTGPLHAAPRGAPLPRPGGAPRPRALPPAGDEGTPPWPPARTPEEAAPALPAPSADPPLGGSPPPILGGQSGSVNQAGSSAHLALPPWARVPAELAAATSDDHLPDWSKGTGSGPMYVWNPATNSAPFPALNPDDE